MASEDAAWTVLVYMAGDNNLTEDMVWGLQELKKTAARLKAETALEPKERINVFAHFDPRDSRSRRYDFVPSVRSLEAAELETTEESGVGQQEAAELEAGVANDDGNLADYQAQIHTRKAVPSPPARQESKQQPVGKRAEATADPSALNPLAAFVSAQVRRLPPAKHYFVILSGHGSGAVGDFLIDSDPVTSLSIPKLAKILKAARTKYKEDTEQDKRIDILGMDSCLMSNAEVCCEVSDDADFLVASEGWVANAGWPYHRVLEACRKDDGSADTDPRSVAENVAKNYSNFYRDYEISEMSTDIAVCNLTAFRVAEPGTLMGYLRELSSALAEAFDTVFFSQELSRIRMNSDAAHTFLAEVSQEIGVPLVSRASSAARSQQSDARATIAKALRKRRLTDSQWRALRDLMRSRKPRRKADEVPDDDDLEKQLPKARAKALPEVLRIFDRPHSPSAALAAARVRREFDPRVVKELERIEKSEANSIKDPEPSKQLDAMRERARLQKLHQVLSATDLVDLQKFVRPKIGRLKRRATQLLNAVVAARWEAQSFKGGVYVDLADFCRCLEARVADGTIKALCQSVRQAIEGSPDGKRLGCAFGAQQTGSANQHATGLSVYFPYQAGDYTTEYENLAFARKTGWERLVRSYLRATRRERKGERIHWKKTQDFVLRFGHSEVDPLEPDGIEARIVGVNTPPTAGNDGKRGPVKAGGEGKIKAGGEGKIKAGGEGKIKAGGEGKIRAGGEGKIRAGSEAKIRGEGVRFVWGNPPDGFFRQGAKK